MRLIHNILMGIVLAALVFSVSCCCTGGLDDDNINQNLPHDQGTADGLKSALFLTCNEKRYGR